MNNVTMEPVSWLFNQLAHEKCDPWTSQLTVEPVDTLTTRPVNEWISSPTDPSTRCLVNYWFLLPRGGLLVWVIICPLSQFMRLCKSQPLVPGAAPGFPNQEPYNIVNMHLLFPGVGGEDFALSPLLKKQQCLVSENFHLFNGRPDT